jgi:hypothetical protein
MADRSDGDYLAYVDGRATALRRIAFLLSGDEHQADDLVQETLTKLYTRWPRMAGVDNLDAYVHTMLVRAFLDDRRRGWWKVRLLSAAPEPLPARAEHDLEERTTPERLKLPPGATQGSAQDIDGDGTILGMVGTAQRETAYLWLPDGTGRALPLPPVTLNGDPQTTKTATSFWSTAIRGGWVTGRAVFETKGSTEFAAYRYNIAENRYELLPTGVRTPAVVAANGWVASGDLRPHLATDTGVVALPALGKQTADTTYEISSISDDGKTITGYDAGPGQGDQTGNDPLVWHCG